MDRTERIREILIKYVDEEVFGVNLNGVHFKDVAKEIAEINDWVSVEDRLPEMGSFVVAHKENGISLGLYYSANKEFMYGNIDQTNQVTHWQPLPNKPSKS